MIVCCNTRLASLIFNTLTDQSGKARKLIGSDWQLSIYSLQNPKPETQLGLSSPPLHFTATDRVMPRPLPLPPSNIGYPRPEQTLPSQPHSAFNPPPLAGLRTDHLQRSEGAEAKADAAVGKRSAGPPLQRSCWQRFYSHVAAVVGAGAPCHAVQFVVQYSHTAG